MLERSTRDLSQALTARPWLFGRRMLFAVLNLGTIVAMLWAMALALSAGGFGVIDALFLVMFGLTLPWTVIGFWNSLIGLIIMLSTRDVTGAVLPPTARIRGDEPIVSSTAIIMCIRNEPPERVIRNLELMITDFAAAGAANGFHIYVLSDTNRADVGAMEDQQFAALAERWKDKPQITYRRRDLNTGYKAGNIRDFCDRWGSRHDFAIVLDTDSLMPASAVLRMVRIMQTQPRLGILQSLVIGLPTLSAFARLFQFGMRLTMRSYTIGSAWWQSDCGPYWGHNAIIRLAPFIAHCHLPLIAGGGATAGHVLSHDQLESALMCAAGYEVRVLPEEDLGWEENPPTLIEFNRRDLRWCQGNLQYLHLFAYPGLRPVSRYHLGFAIFMFLGSPAWIGMLFLGTLMTAFAKSTSDVIVSSIGIPLFWIVYLMWFTPNWTTAVDVLLRPDLRRDFGGALIFAVNFIASVIFTTLLYPIMWFGHAVFMIGLLFGRSVGWIGQMRDEHEVSFTVAARSYWPHTVFGWAVIVILAATHPVAVPYALAIAGGLALSIPLAVFTARPSIGRWMTRVGIARLPEETSPPPLLKTLALPAIVVANPTGRGS